MCIRLRAHFAPLAAVAIALSLACDLAAADRVHPFTVSETAGIRRRNDVITIRTSAPEVVEHTGGYRIRNVGTMAAQFRRVEWPGEPPQLVADFIDDFPPLESRGYVLELTDETTAHEPTRGLALTETDEAWQIDSSGVVHWTIRKDLRGLLDFSWRESDYIANDSTGLFFSAVDGETHNLSQRAPTRAAVERSGPVATSLRFDYDDWPPGARSSVRLEFVRTKSWIRGEWTVGGDVDSISRIGGVLNLRLNGSEYLIDFGGGDFVYTTVTRRESAVLSAGPRVGATVPWRVYHGADEQEQVATAPGDVPTPKVHGWAHVMDDKRATALAVDDFGEASTDAITVNGNGQLRWIRQYDAAAAKQTRQLEFWLHFVSMPVHIGARTSARSMQEPLKVEWNND